MLNQRASQTLAQPAMACERNADAREDRGPDVSYADGSHAGPTAAVRNTESFVQIEMADIPAIVAGACQSHLRIEVSTVHVNLSAVVMNEVANRPYRGLEHPMRRGIGDHDRGEPVGVLLGLGAKIGQIHVAVRIAADRHDLHAGHMRRCWIGAVRRGRNRQIVR